MAQNPQDPFLALIQALIPQESKGSSSPLLEEALKHLTGHPLFEKRGAGSPSGSLLDMVFGNEGPLSEAERLWADVRERAAREKTPSEAPQEKAFGEAPTGPPPAEDLTLRSEENEAEYLVLTRSPDEAGFSRPSLLSHGNEAEALEEARNLQAKDAKMEIIIRERRFTQRIWAL